VYAVAEHLKNAGPPRTPASLSATVLSHWPQAGLPEGIVTERHVLDLVPASLVRALLPPAGQCLPAGSLIRSTERSHSPAGKVTGCGAISGVPTSSWICACAVRGMSRGLPR
jgi:hypothetical protein